MPGLVSAGLVKPLGIVSETADVHVAPRSPTFVVVPRGWNREVENKSVYYTR